MNYMTPSIKFLLKVSNWHFKIFFLQFSLLLFIKTKNVFSICVSCHPLHDISKTPNYYRVTLTGSIGGSLFLFKFWIKLVFRQLSGITVKTTYKKKHTNTLIVRKVCFYCHKGGKALWQLRAQFCEKYSCSRCLDT